MTWELVVLAFAVSRIARLVVSDAILDTPRNWFLSRFPADTTQFGDSEVIQGGKGSLGERVGRLRGSFVDVFKSGDAWYAAEPRWVGNLVSCAWCVSVWVAIAVWAGYFFYPDLVYWLAPLALAEAAGLLNDRK